MVRPPLRRAGPGFVLDLSPRLGELLVFELEGSGCKNPMRLCCLRFSDFVFLRAIFNAVCGRNMQSVFVSVGQCGVVVWAPRLVAAGRSHD